MPSIDNNPHFLPLGILHYFNAGFSKEDILTNLLKSQTKNPKLYPRIDYRDVDFWYNSFENGNLDLDQEPKYPELTEFINLPVLDKIIHEVNVKDQLNLRKTCKTLKGMIEKENRLYEEIYFHINGDVIMLETTCGISGKKERTDFKIKGEGSEIVKGNRTISSRKTQLIASLIAFKKIVEVKHTKVKELDLCRGSENGEFKTKRKNFVLGIIKVLNGLKDKLHVENLIIDLKDPKVLDNLLGAIKPGTLISISCFNEKKLKSPIGPNLQEHMKWLDELLLDDTNIKLATFVNIPVLNITYPQLPSLKGIMKHRNKIMEQPKFREHSIHYGSKTTPTMEEWKNVLEPFTPIEVCDSWLKGSFPISGQNEHKMKFFLRTDDRFIEFSKEGSE